ncbi:hypothetical protein I3843_07G065300 [Carya illinoinensis]|uniref:EF-hand domain-containing protein n=1 Tax=Carya illinoinensis TaxID=32201 RepID=A0A8T1Q0M4_CARIL|nr:uncharacterized protein LOC122316721 [Carya illinoinensis]KAG6647267.1 hypothetical protein CIPAW_07G067000 [Carya illinoinensis]KAG7970121.1 hypothetical protein I3843_07G065300 [Carya illinoinensis]
MSDSALTILDGTHLRALDQTLPDHGPALTGAEVLDLADSRVSSALFGVSLPETVKSSALQSIHVNDVLSFRHTQLSRDQASRSLADYLNAIADRLKDDPLVISILDGKILQLFLDDEDDFAMISENLFTDLDAEDKGKISKGEIRNALVLMGVEMGVPPFSEFPLLNDILRKHEPEGEEELGQAQFAQSLQPVLQELAEALAEKHVVCIRNIRIINGSRLKKILGDEEELNNVVRKIVEEKQSGKDSVGSFELIRGFLERNGKALGLPPLEADETVVLLYNAVFADVKDGKSDVDIENDKLGKLVKEVLEKFAEQLEANPVYHALDR